MRKIFLELVHKLADQSERVLSDVVFDTLRDRGKATRRCSLSRVRARPIPYGNTSTPFISSGALGKGRCQWLHAKAAAALH